MKECRVELDKGAPEIKTDVESHSTEECKRLRPFKNFVIIQVNRYTGFEYVNLG